MLRKTVNDNLNFRLVLQTTKNEQLVAMDIPPYDDIGLESHPEDQYVYVEKGHGIVSIDGEDYEAEPGFGIIIPGGSYHNVINTSDQDLKIIVIYSPPKHPLGEVTRYKTED